MKYATIIDVDGIIFAIASVLKKAYTSAIETKNEYQLNKLDKQSINMIQNKFREVFLYTNCDRFIGFIKGYNCNEYRKQIDPLYKYKREKDLMLYQILNRIQNLAIKRYKLYSVNNIEVDDACVITHHHYNKKYKEDINKKPILVSPDKDLLQIEGHHIRLLNIPEYMNLSKEEAQYKLYTQIITGDSVDGIKGIEGSGEVAAKKILNEPGHYARKVLNAYITKYGKEGKTQYNKNFKLVFMLRYYKHFNIPKWILIEN